MNKEKIPYNRGSGGYPVEKSADIYSSRSEASDTENMKEGNNANISRSGLSAKSIDFNDDDDEDEI